MDQNWCNVINNETAYPIYVQIGCELKNKNDIN